MSKRFFGTLPKTITIKIEKPTHAFPDSHKEALSRAGRKPKAEKPLSPLKGETEIGATRDFAASRAS